MKYKKYLKKAAAAVSVAAVGITTVMAPMAVSAKTAEDMGLTLENVQANDYVLYTVNCGTPDPSVIPNQDSERLGLLQSNVDQEYGEDPETGITWGRNPANEYSQAVNRSATVSSICRTAYSLTNIKVRSATHLKCRRTQSRDWSRIHMRSQ